MLPKINRLNLKDNKSLKGKKVKSDKFTLIWGKGQGISEIGIIVPKKVAKKAVDRNRIRRIVKESLINNLIEGKLLVIVNKNVADLKTKQISQILKDQIKQFK